MSFLRRLGGGGSKGFTLNVTYFARMRDDAMVPVVGEYYRQKQVVSARPPRPNDLPPRMPPPPPGYLKAMLTPEPKNQYDPNAIAVLLWAGGSWSMAGYLSRTDAANYQPVFRHLAVGHQSPPAVTCDAAFTLASSSFTDAGKSSRTSGSVHPRSRRPLPSLARLRRSRRLSGQLARPRRGRHS